MNTLEMMNVAKKNDKTYFNESNDIIYSKELGFFDSFNSEPITMGDFNTAFTLNNFMSLDWREVTTMTRAEAEEKYDIKIIEW